MVEDTRDTPLEGEFLSESTNYQVFMLALSIYAVIIWVGLFILPIRTSTEEILLILDHLFAVIFLYDFIRRLVRSPNKLDFMKWGWLDLLSSIPGLPLLRIFRLAGIYRARQELRKTTGRSLIANFRERRGESALLSLIFSLLVLILFASILIIQFEAGAPGSTIETGGDSIWWSFVTMTTVGYGDMVPVSNEGRMVGLIVMTAGVAMVGVLTGYLANHFAPDEVEDEQLAEIKKELSEIKQLLQRVDRGNLAAEQDD